MRAANSLLLFLLLQWGTKSCLLVGGVSPPEEVAETYGSILDAYDANNRISEECARHRDVCVERRVPVQSCLITGATPQFVQVFQKLVLDNIDKEWRIAEDEFRAFVARHSNALTAPHGTPHPAKLPGASWEAAIVTWDDEVLKEFAGKLRSWKRKVLRARWVRSTRNVCVAV